VAGVYEVDRRGKMFIVKPVFADNGFFKYELKKEYEL